MDNNSIFNYDYIRQQAHQRQHHNEQILQVQDTVHKLKDFLDSSDKIEPAYKEMANTEICAILLDYAKKHGMI